MFEISAEKQIRIKANFLDPVFHRTFFRAYLGWQNQDKLFKNGNAEFAWK